MPTGRYGWRLNIFRIARAQCWRIGVRSSGASFRKIGPTNASGTADVIPLRYSCGRAYPDQGTGNARAIAGIHAILATGGVAKGKRFLSEPGRRKALEVQVSGRDRILGFPIRNGLGFAVSGGVFAFPNPNTIYWGGYGGSLAVIDMDARISVGYAMNKM